jgi:RHS repeat-associated protein
MNTSSLRIALSAVILWGLAGSVRGQITSNAGDGVLNAPYRGTITSLREACEDIPYGEVKTHCEPLFGDTNLITSSTISMWVEGTWDRSVLRLYEGADASGTELNLSGTSQGNPLVRSVSGGFHRMSVKAIGIKTLTPQTFTIKFQYSINDTPTTPTRMFTVAPMTGSFSSLPGESESFHLGTPILNVNVGAASLVVPVGRTAEMIGATFEDKDRRLGPSTMVTTDVLFPGAAESVFVAQQPQFRLNESSYAKTTWGTPWPGQLIGFYNSGDTFGPDGTHFDSLVNPSTDGMRRYDRVRPKGVDPASVQYTYDNSSSNLVTEIRDQATPPNVITLTRVGGVVSQISTSDGRSWQVGSLPVEGWITSVRPIGATGGRSFAYNSAGRVTQVKDADDRVMYEFTYANDPSEMPTILTEERRFVDNALRTVVEHQVVSESLQRRKEYVAAGQYRQFDFNYDAANGLKHRLAGVTSYGEVNTTGVPFTGGAGTPFTTTYTHDANNAAGSMVITQVDLPDGSTIHHDYDAHIGAQTVKFGFRTKSTRTGPDDGSLVKFDVTYEFFYTSPARLFYRPRIVKQRDGRGALSEVTFDYENGFDDQNFDGCEGQDCNQLFKRTGPTIALGTSGTRTPETRFTYDGNRMLMREETDFASGMHRAVEFGYDDLLRLTTQTRDPGGESIVTRFLYCDTATTQDRITVDPDGFWTRTRFDNNGRLTTTGRFLNANAGNLADPCADPTGPFYKATNVYDNNGRLNQQLVENKDQDGVSLTPATITTTFSFDRIGRLESRTLDPGGIGQVSHFDYNWFGETEREFDTSGRGTSRIYDGRGLVKSETPLALDEAPDNNLTTTFTYDAMGNLRFTNRPTGAVEERVYDDFDRLKQSKRIPGPDGGNTITTTFEYDLANHVTRTAVDEAATVLSDSTAKFDEGGFNYESRQRTVAAADNANDPLTQRKFDWAGNVTEEKALGDATVADRIITTEYDGANRVRRVTDSLGGETIFARDDRGNVLDQTVKIDATNSALTTTVYDALSRAIQITSPEDGAGGRPDRIRRYDSRNNLLRETIRDASDVPKLTTVFGYDNAGQQSRHAVLASAASTILASAASVTTDRVTDSVYDADGRLEIRRTYNNNSATPLNTTTTYDDLGRVDRVTDPSNSFTDEDYADNGRLSLRSVFDGVGLRTFTFGYDGHDRIKQQAAVGSPDLVTMFTLDGLDRQKRLTDPKGIATRTDFDLVGRRKTLVEDDTGPLQRQTDFAYNRLSQPIRQTAQNKTSTGASLANQVTDYRYDSLGRQTRIVYPDSAQHADPPNCTDCVRQTFDLAGRMTQRIDQRLLTTALAYDDRGLLLTRTTGTDRDTFGYDAVGRITLADRGTTGSQAAVSHSAMAYTDVGDLDFETQSIAGGTARTVDYGYDQAGNRKQLTYPGAEVLTYTPTVLNQVGTVNLNAAPFLDYVYQGRLLDKRKTITTAPGGNTVYEYHVGYDSHRRVNAITNRFQPGGGNPQTVAAYGFTHDNNGNPLTQTATEGLAGFVADDRAFTVDRLNRLKETEYFENGQVESDALDLVGNRESHTDRAGTVTAYGTVNAANEYPTIGGNPLTYDAAGNLTVDQAGRQYSYDEHNRLKQIKNASNVVLANYTYDALGRRIIYNDPVAGVTTRYYYDGQTVIEERNTADTRVRYHVNGSQFIDEHVATFTQATSQFTYYLPNSNFSVAGTGNSDGSLIERLDYSATGDFAGGGAGASSFYHDADQDLDIDLRDFANFQNCFDPTPPVTPACATVHDFDTNNAHDGDIDLNDYVRFASCFNGPFVTPDPACGIPPNTAALPVSGMFTLHGRPADILSDGHALLDFRARFYDPAVGRWLQRDPLAYNDGANLYDAFKGNPLSNRDPLGEGFLTWWFNDDYQQRDADFVRGFFSGAATAIGNAGIGAGKGARELAFTAADIVVALIDIVSTLAFHESLGRPFSQLGQAATNPDSLARLMATTGSRNVLNAVTAGGFNVLEGTVVYYRTGDAEALSQNVGGQGLLTLATVGAVRGVAAGRGVGAGPVADLTRRSLTPQALRLQANVARGELGEINAQALQRSLGETIVNTQFRQGTALRGFESVSAVQTAAGLRVFVTEVKTIAGNVTPSRLSAFGLNRAATFEGNISFAQRAVAGQVTDLPLQRTILQALEERTFTVRILGPRGIRVSPSTSSRLQTVTGATEIEIVDILVVP